MTPVLGWIQCLESYIERNGARLLRTRLPDAVHGRVCRDQIILRTGLSPEQEVVALVHELAHWLLHRDAQAGHNCTLFEYEAEAVESLVMNRLAALQRGRCPTDNLLSASVARANWAADQICDALGVDPLALEAQSPIDVQTPAGEEFVFEYELYGMGDFFGLPKAL